MLAFTKPPSRDQPGQTLRIVPALIGTIAGNLAIANLTLDDYVSAADDDGVLRGFIPPVGNFTKAEIVAAAAQNTSTAVLAQFYEEARTLHYVVATVNEVDLARAHAQVTSRNYSMAEVVLGREEYLEACRAGGRAHGTSLPLPEGANWSFFRSANEAPFGRNEGSNAAASAVVGLALTRPCGRQVVVSLQHVSLPVHVALHPFSAGACVSPSPT